MNRKWMVALIIGASALASQAQNVLLNTNATSSAATSPANAAYANDGDLNSAWNASGYAPAWVQIEVPINHPPLGLIRLIPAQTPSGDTSHSISVQRQDGRWEEVASINRYTSDKQPIDVSFKKPLSDIKQIKVTTKQSPSWVAWYEIQAFATGNLLEMVAGKRATQNAIPIVPTQAQDIDVQSVPSCGENGDGTVTGVDGSIWQLCLIGQTYEGGSCAGLPKDMKWPDAMHSAESNRFQGKSDWVLPSASLFDKSFSIKNCSHPNVRKWSVEYEWARPVDKVKMTGIFWTSTMESDALVRVMDDSYVYGKNVVFLDTNKDASSGEKYYQNVRTVLVRNVPESAKGDYSRALKRIQDCSKNSKCRSAREKQQQEVDRQSIADFQERWKNLGRQVGTAMSGNSSSSDGSTANVTFGSWKVIKKYDGGFADFGFDWRSTVYVVRCGSGAEKKIYSDKKGLWGTVGLGGNNGSSTFEDAANKNCK